MTWLRWFAQRVLHLLGLDGIAGIALLAGSGAFYGIAVFPLNQQVDLLKAATPIAYDRQRDLKRIAAEEDPAAQLNAFYQHFASDEPLTDWLGRIYDP